MAPLKLEGDTLGKKRQHYNKLVEDAIANKHYELCDISGDDSDIDNLLKIDIASRTRNVDYIIEVMKSKDMLYAATAIKKSTWLITEQQYANIINPEYLHTQLLPSMNTKTFNKLMLHIRLNLKDESRVESFYEYLEEEDSAYKWLQNCSIPFIENVIKNKCLVPLSLFKRLCKRSAHFLAYYTRIELSSKYEVKKEILFLLKSHTEDVLNIVEDEVYEYFPKMGKKKTTILMKTCPKRVLYNFDKYADTIDLAVVAKYLNKNEIKAFLYKQAKTLGHRLCDYDTIRHFIKNMPKEERYKFVKKTFIDKTEMSLLFSEEEGRIIESNMNPYQWYEFAPFDVALHEYKMFIIAENSPSERNAMFSILITSARRNPDHIKTLLNFVKDKHINEPFKFKIQFVNNFLSQISTHEFDVETWNVLDQLFHSMEVYTDSDNNVQLCLESIILYKVLNDEPVPKIVEQKMTFNGFVKIQKKVNEEQNDKIFTYLLNFLMTKVQSENIANESDFSNTIVKLKNALSLIRDWKKDISKYPNVLDKIRELVKIKHQNMWKTDMSCLYNMKKSWRKHMFEESLSLYLCEEACLNALKHNPQLLTRHDKEIDTLRTNDAVSLRRLLAKLRVYWPHSLAQHWTAAYLLNLNEPTGQKAVVRGLFLLLPQNQVIDMAKKYAPNDFKINWDGNNKTEINIRINIAKHLHVARPLIPLDTVLWYAKGDYLKYAVPSLIAIISKLSLAESRKNNSLRKLGVHLGFSKLKPEEFKSLTLNIWNTTTNSLVRSVIFKNTFGQICKVKNTAVEKELWKILSWFFDKFPLQDNREIIQCLDKVENVPISVRAEFYMKSYKVLTSFPDIDKSDWLVNRLVSYARYTPKIVESLDDDFVTDKLLTPAGAKFSLRDSQFIDIFASYVLWAKTEEDQLQRFRKVVDPAMDEAFLLWRRDGADDFYDITNFKQFIQYLIDNYKNFTLSRRTTPSKLFTEIKVKMEKNMQLLENYALYTTWKLIIEYAKLMDQHICKMGNAWLLGESENVWNEIHVAMFPELGSLIVKCLKEDTEQYFPSICLLFTDSFNYFNGIFSYNCEFKLEILKHMLNDHAFIHCYVVVSRVIAKDLIHAVNDSLKKIQTEICDKIKSHPSQEVQMHYYSVLEKYQNDEYEE